MKKTIKNIICIMFMVCLLSLCTSASEINSDFEIAEGVLIRYHGNNPDVAIPDRVTAIGDNAFKDCDFLVSVTIPNSVIYISGGAFRYCDYLTTVKLPKNLTKIERSTFSKCSSLKNINLPDNLLTIGYWAFEGCESLTDIKIPETVTSIGIGAFNDCTSLKNIIIPDSVSDIVIYYRNDSNVVIPDRVTSIPNRAFEGFSSLKSIQLHDNINFIGLAAFKDCTALKSIVIPKNVIAIGMNTFENCTSLTSVVIPDGLTFVNTGAFRNCTSLKSIVIPKSVVKFGDHGIFDRSIIIYGEANSAAEEYAKEANIKFIRVNFLGDVLNSDISAYINTHEIPSYNIDGKTMVAVDDLTNYGFDVVWDSTPRTFKISYDKNSKKEIKSLKIEKNTTPVSSIRFQYFSTDIKTYVNGKEILSYNITGKTIIQFDELKVYGSVTWDKKTKSSNFNAD